MNFYRMETTSDEEGNPHLRCITYTQFRETAHYHFVRSHPWAKVRRIAKSGSKIAVPSKDAAYSALIRRKRWHAAFLERDLELARKFLALAECATWQDFPR